MKIRERYQAGVLRKEKRKKVGAIWTLMWREKDANGRTIRRKEIVGTIEQYPTKASAQKACEVFRSTINCDTRVPRSVNDLVTHYTKNELPKKSPYGQEVYTGYITQWILPRWGECSLSDVRTVQVEVVCDSISHLRGLGVRLTDSRRHKAVMGSDHERGFRQAGRSRAGPGE